MILCPPPAGAAGTIMEQKDKEVPLPPCGTCHMWDLMRILVINCPQLDTGANISLLERMKYVFVSKIAAKLYFLSTLPCVIHWPDRIL